MRAKLLIFVIISAVFASSISTAISSSPVAFAASACFVVTEKTHYCTSNVSEKWYECTLHPDGVRRCTQFPEPKEPPKKFILTDDSMPPGLKDGLDAAIAESQSNDTKIPKGGILDDGAPLTQGDTGTTGTAAGGLGIGISTQCISISSRMELCTTTDYDNDFEVTNWVCTTKDGGETWQCRKTQPAKAGEDAIPAELGEALDIAMGETQGNDTKPLDTGVLDEPGALSDDESTENGDDTEVPEDRGGLNDDDDGAPTINPGLP